MKSRQQGLPAPRSVSYRRIQEDYGAWLATLGYSASTVYNHPRQAGEFLAWLEQRGYNSLQNIPPAACADFLAVYSVRPNLRRGGGISAARIRHCIDALRLLSRYLHHSGRGRLIIGVSLPPAEAASPRIVLSRAEIRALYAACGPGPLGLRDRALLGLYYACGLRRSEGVALDAGDVLAERGLLRIRQSKTRRERYALIAAAALADITDYLSAGRPVLLGEDSREPALLISNRGRRLHPESARWRLQRLCEKSGIGRCVGLHSLRHSIATHLLEAGMALEDIVRFLGHAGPDSTMIYTHISGGRHGTDS